AGEAKVLAITAEERLEGDVVEDFETGMEQGIDESYVNWRGFMGPPDLDDDALAYYEDAFEQLTVADGCDEIKAQNGWEDLYMASEEFEELLDEEEAETEEVLQAVDVSE